MSGYASQIPRFVVSLYHPHTNPPSLLPRISNFPVSPVSWKGAGTGKMLSPIRNAKSRAETSA
eukprot:97115-Pleurochrysis_carterae.AAC.1